MKKYLIPLSAVPAFFLSGCGGGTESIALIAGLQSQVVALVSILGAVGTGTVMLGTGLAVAIFRLKTKRGKS